MEHSRTLIRWTTKQYNHDDHQMADPNTIKILLLYFVHIIKHEYYRECRNKDMRR